MKHNILYLVLIFLILQSCKTKQKASELNYMQNIEKIVLESSAQNKLGILQPGDQIMIYITAKDMDVVRPFNQNYSSAQSTTAIAGGGNTSAIAPTPVSGPIYTVDSNGGIDFPVLGVVSTSGKTVDGLKEDLRERLSEFVKNPTINIRLTNYKINVLGEVNRPGPYLIPEGKANILEALGLAGETTIYGKRNDVLIYREENGKILTGKVDLKDANFINSPFFNLKQGDIIYVSSNENKEVVSRTNPNTSLYLTAISVGIGALALIIGLVKK